MTQTAQGMLRVAALTSGRCRPSSRFRVRQHIPGLAERGILVDEFVPAIDKYARVPGWPEGISQGYAGPFFLAWLGMKLATHLPGMLGSWTHHITWLQREMLPGIPSLERCLKGPLVFDVDDAVWLTPPVGSYTVQGIAKRADVVIAGNRYLADWFANYCRDVRIVPTAINTERFRPAHSGTVAEKRWFTIGWTGESSNFSYLAMIHKPLIRFLSEHLNTRLLVIADRPPEFQPPNPHQLHFVPWTEEAEVQAVQAMDVGLMPLPDTPWTRGKCSFKMLQYMACGVPVIVSPVGMNAEVLSLGHVGLAATQASDWYDALTWLYRNRDQACHYGRQGRSVAERFFSHTVIAQQLAQIFHGLL